MDFEVWIFLAYCYCHASLSMNKCEVLSYNNIQLFTHPNIAIMKAGQESLVRSRVDLIEQW